MISLDVDIKSVLKMVGQWPTLRLRCWFRCACGDGWIDTTNRGGLGDAIRVDAAAGYRPMSGRSGCANVPAMGAGLYPQSIPV